MNTKEKRRKRLELVTQARALHDKAETEKRTFAADEEQQYQKIMTDVEELRKAIEREEHLEQAEKEAAGQEREDGREKEKRGGAPDLESRAFVKFLSDPNRLTAEESRALQVDNPTSGGYMVIPQVIMDRVIKAVDNEVFVRQLADVLPGVLNAESLGIPSLDADPADPEWTGEISSASEDSSMSFGKRELKPHPLRKLLKISTKYLRKATQGEQFVIGRLSYKLSTTLENAYLNGNGSGRPLGVFTAATTGISTGRDVSTDNTTTAMTFDGLKNAKYTLKAQYWPRANWIFHRDGLKQIDKIKDGDGQYIWQPSVVAGAPDRLLNFPVRVSEYAPNTFTTGLYTGILGDFKFYQIVDSLAMKIQRLMELYAVSSQVGFIIEYEGDGMPILEEAFVRVKLA